MSIKFFINRKDQPTKRFYFFPRWLNSISWEPNKNQTKIYKWLFFGWSIK
jgi:hypothetical protein